MHPEREEGAAPSEAAPQLYKHIQQSNYRTDRAFWATAWWTLGALSVAQIVVSVCPAVHA